MRRISRTGTLWIIGTVLIGTGMLQPSIVVSAESKPSITVRAFFVEPRPPSAYRAPTPQPRKPSVDPNAAFAAKVKPGSFALVLNDGNRYIWTPAADQKLPLKTAFAKVEVPLALVASVTFSDEQGAVKVAFRNGDIVSGKLLLKELEIRTAYGDLTVPVSAMTFLGAGGVKRVATKPREPAVPRSRYESGDSLPPRPVPTARIDRVRR